MCLTSWIPEKYAAKGKVLTLKNQDGEWETGWEITSTGIKKKAELVEASERAYLYQRKTSDK